MIQRIQTIFLFLAAGALNSFSFLEPSTLFFEVFNEGVSAILAILAGLVALISIFLFKNRKLQLNLVRFATLSSLGAIASLFLIQPWEHIVKLWPFYLLPVGLVLLILAIRGIKSDEKLVKSLDRLR